MQNKEQEDRNQIKQALFMHGQLSILFYQMSDEWIVKKWGPYDDLITHQNKLYDQFMEAGLKEGAESITLMELPRDEDMIYRILHCGALKNILGEYQILQNT